MSVDFVYVHRIDEAVVGTDGVRGPRPDDEPRPVGSQRTVDELCRPVVRRGVDVRLAPVAPAQGALVHHAPIGRRPRRERVRSDEQRGAVLGDEHVRAEPFGAFASGEFLLDAPDATRVAGEPGTVPANCRASSSPAAVTTTVSPATSTDGPSLDVLSAPRGEVPALQRPHGGNTDNRFEDTRGDPEGIVDVRSSYSYTRPAADRVSCRSLP